MACATAVRIQYLPPAPPRRGLSFDQYVRGQRHFPVDAHAIANGEVESNGISWEDFGRMGTFQHKQAGERRLPTPEWSLSDSKLRAVVVRYVEYRAWCRSGFKSVGSEAERLRAAQRRLDEQRPHKIKVLDRLARELLFLQKANGPYARIKKLREEVSNQDTQLRFNENAAAHVLHIANCYYRQNLDSVGTSIATGFRPNHVRVILWRLNIIWRRMQQQPNSTVKQ